MRVLVIGSGAREHAIVWKLLQSKKVSKIFAVPGNGGISQIAECVNIHLDDIDTILAFALKESIDLTIVGPEGPLVDGIVDKFNEKGLKIFGPCKKGAMLEGSKKFSKEFMLKYGIPTAKYAAYHNLDKAIKGLEEFTFPLVIKADGLASGKGVIICNDKEEAHEALRGMLEDKRFGDAGNEIIIEEFLEGIEASLMCLVSGNKIIPLESARDHKRLLDNDEGPNTGGMGCISPNEILGEKLISEIKVEILDKIMNGMQNEKLDFKGVLFIGLMITPNGAKVLEFNVRFGDPETEVVLPRLENDIAEIFLKTIDGTISQEELKWSQKSCVCTVLASAGYPETYEKGRTISGLEKVDKDVLVFHAGTKKENGIKTNGGRVLAVTTLSDSLDEGRKKVYENINKIHFDGMQYRKDIGIEKKERAGAMKIFYKGKTKNIYVLEDGNYLLKFKDDVTGENGVFDPGANSVGLSIEGSGRAGLKMTKFFFEILKEKGIPTHYIDSNLEETTMTVKPAKLFGRGLEVICRYKAVGSFIRRYGAYAEEGQPLDAYVEFTLKDDHRQDPLITEDALTMLGILSSDEYKTLKDLTKKIAGIIKEELAKKDIELYDIKFEFGRVGEDNQIVLIDEISGGNMRAYKDGEYIEPLKLEKLILE